MICKKISAAMLALLLAAAPQTAARDDSREQYEKAVELYSSGLYDEAKMLFDAISPDVRAEGYSVLCALKLRTADYESLMENYEQAYRHSTLLPQIRFENAKLLFERGEYAQAALEFSKVKPNAVTGEIASELYFRQAYSYYEIGEYDEAFKLFEKVEAWPESEYLAPSRYFRAVTLYSGEQFEKAEELFEKAGEDPRFESVCRFYIVDCEFNRRNYEFALREGERIFATVPEERQERLSRIISESALILGDADKARRYYDGFSGAAMNRSDLFYAGSVMYSVKDYAGAIEKFEQIPDRSDAVGQIANYHLANSYLHTGNRVAAMEAFRQAASVNYDATITEDAFFNYAKLAFDLNKDTNGFSDYIKRYSTKSRGVQIYGYMALAALYDKDYASAVEAYDSIDELSPDMLNNYTKANFLRGEQLFAGESYTDAVPYYRATAYYLPRTDRLNQLARYRYAQASYLAGDNNDAIREYTTLFNASALDGTVQGAILPYNIGYAYFKEQEYSEAAKWFDVYLSSGNPLYREDALTRRADCDFGNRNYKAAVASYQAVLSEFFSPDKIYPYYQQALAYGLSGDNRRKASVLKYVNNASKDVPMYNEACYELGRAQMETGDNKGAEATFTALKKSSGDKTWRARATIGLGMAHRNRNNYEAALSSYKEVVSMMPGSQYAEEAMLAIESIYQRLRQPEKFLEYVEQNQLNTNKSDAEREKMFFNTAQQLYLAGNYNETIKTINRLLESYPSSPDAAQAHFYLAESYRELGDKEKAVAAYAKAMQANSEYSFAEMSKLRYAELSYQLQRYQDAYKGYSALLAGAAMEANRATARAGMMNSAYRCKDYSNAVKAAQAVLAQEGIEAEESAQAKYVMAKSYLAMSERQKAMELFTELGANPSNAIGAESRYLLIENLFNVGDYTNVENEVYTFSQTAGNQSYWLAKAYVVLGDSFYERGMTDQAKATYESVRDGYRPFGSEDDVPDMVARRMERFNVN